MNFSFLIRMSYFVLDFFHVFVIHVFFRAWFGKPNNRLKLIIIYSVLIAADCLIYFTQDSALIFSLSAYLLLLMCSLIYSRITIRSFIGAGVLLMLTVASEMLALIFTTFADNSEMSTIIMYVILAILRYLLTVLSMQIFRNTRMYRMTPQYSAGIIITSFVSIWIIVYISYLLGYSTNYSTNYADALLLVTYFFILALNIISFYTFDRQFNKYKLEQKNASLENALKTQQNEQELNKEHERNVRRIRHDLVNYIIGVKSMIESGAYDKAVVSLEDKIDDMYSAGQYAHTGCTPVDSIINYKASKAEKHNIRIITNLIVRAVPPISDEDICVIIGNGMDNAIEYLASHPDVKQVIQINLDYGPVGFILGIQNYVDRPIELSAGRYIRTTKSGPGHGFGIESADIIAHKYDGEIIINCENNIFVYGAVLHPGSWPPPK